jgi:hypothetical protein
MAQTLAALSAAPLELIWQSEVIATARTKEEPVLGCFLVMEEREQLFGDLKRYRALLRYTTDEQASAAIKQLIREIYERLDSNKVEVRLTRSSGANLMSARPLLTHAEMGADLEQGALSMTLSQ